MTLHPEKHASPYKFFIGANKRVLPIIGINIVLYNLGAASMFVTTFFLGKVVDAATATEPIPTVLLGLLIAGILGYEVFYRLGHMCEVYVRSVVVSNIKKRLFDHTTSLSFGYFADRFAGEIAHKVSATATALDEMWLIITNNFIHSALLVPLSAVVLGLIHPYFAILILAWAGYLSLGSTFLAKKMNHYTQKHAVEEAKTVGAVVDVYSNIATVKVYGRAQGAARAHTQIDAERKAYLRFGKWEVIMYHFQGTSIVFLSLGVIAITAHLLSMSVITLGTVVFISTATLRLFDVAWEMGYNVAGFIRYYGEASQNLKDLVVAPKIVDGHHVGHVHQESSIGVLYENVYFSYNKQEQILEDFSFEILPGEKVGIVGLSGSGKTTFANLLLRFFDVQQGCVRINDVDIKEFPQEYLRQHISYISQDTSLFHATVAENIAYGSEAASHDDIVRAAKLAHADEFISKLSKGYESIVGERGVKLSGGQRQRIAIARAILANRPIFLLDEATSALDSESEQKIQHGLDALMEGKTVIAIAHRLSTLANMDRIVFLEKGKIIEEGTHDELLQLRGKYAELWNLQAGGFLPS